MIIVEKHTISSQHNLYFAGNDYHFRTLLVFASCG